MLSVGALVNVHWDDGFWYDARVELWEERGRYLVSFDDDSDGDVRLVESKSLCAKSAPKRSWVNKKLEVYDVGRFVDDTFYKAGWVQGKIISVDAKKRSFIWRAKKGDNRAKATIF